MAARTNKVSSSVEASMTVLAEKKRCSRAASEDIFVEEGGE